MKIENISVGDHEVELWEFYFDVGAPLEVVVDKAYGDTHDFPPAGPLATFRIVEKPSPVDPEGTMEPKDIYIPMQNLKHAHKYTRMVREVPIEQKEEWHNYLKDMVNDPKYKLGN